MTPTLIKPDITLDVSGLTCPGPLVSAKRLLDDVQNGQIMLLISDCPGTPSDLTAWAKHTQNQIIQIDELGGRKLGFYIQKGDPWKASVTLDTVGARCPGPVIEAAHLLRGLNDGEILKLLSNCDSAVKDVESWALTTGHKLLGQRRDSNGVISFFIQK